MKLLNNNDSFDELINEKLVLVDFFADWCGPCKMLTPNLEELSKDYKIVKVNVDEFEDIARRYGIMSIPALYLFKDGEVIDKKIGYQSLDELQEWLNSKA